MMTQRKTAWIVLVAALAALGASVGWAVSAATSSSGRADGPGYGRGYAMMGLDRHAAPWYVAGSNKPVQTIAAARSQAQTFAARLDLRTGEVMRFANNFYVLLENKQGKPVTEVLVDPRSGLVTLEYGPAMMWNTRYGMMNGSGKSGGTVGGPGSGGMMGQAGTGGSGPGMMGGSGSGGMMSGGGMMGRYGGSPNWTPSTGSISGPVDATRAERLADRWLAPQGKDLTATQPDALPGYFTFHVLENGKISGMLSVNQRTGAIWYHWWHGRFISMAE